MTQTKNTRIKCLITDFDETFFRTAISVGNSFNDYLQAQKAGVRFVGLAGIPLMQSNLRHMDRQSIRLSS